MCNKNNITKCAPCKHCLVELSKCVIKEPLYYKHEYKISNYHHCSNYYDLQLKNIQPELTVRYMVRC